MNKWYALLLTCFCLQGLNNLHAMEQETKIEAKDPEPEEGPFAQLDPGTKLDVIVRIARAGTLQEAVENIRNLALVNKEFNELINSKAGINAIINEGLMKNKNIKSLFNQLDEVYQEYKEENKKKDWIVWGDINIQNDNVRKNILLAVLPIKQAKTLLLEKSPKELSSMEDNLSALMEILSTIKDKNYPASFIKSIIFMALRIANALKYRDQIDECTLFYLNTTLQGYPVYRSMWEPYKSLFE